MTLETLLPIVLLVLVFYLLIVRPSMARQKQYAALRRMQDELQVGAQVMISSGIHGTIRSIEDDTVGLEVAPGTVITVARAAIAEVRSEADA